MSITKSVVTLTTSESKRLIAKGIAQLPEVRKAYAQGIVGLPLCTSNVYVYEELSGKKMEGSEGYCCGYIFEKGFCAVNFSKLLPEVVFVKGNEEHLNFPAENLKLYVDKMTHEDVIIKSGNLLDINKKAAVLAGEPNGGEFGAIMPYILSKGIRLIVPMTINKTAPVDLDEVISEMGMEKISLDMSHGMVCGMLPMPAAKVITEIEALKLLTGVDALPVAMGGVGSGEGCVTLLLSGEDNWVKAAWDLVSSIKGETRFLPVLRNCSQCSVIDLGVLCPIREKIDTKKNSHK